MKAPIYSQSSNSLPTGSMWKLQERNENKVVEMGSAGFDFTGNGKLSHDTTMERIGWRVTPAADLGGDGRDGVARAVVWLPYRTLSQRAVSRLVSIPKSLRIRRGAPGIQTPEELVRGV
jgi:hypothetical protein